LATTYLTDVLLTAGQGGSVGGDSKCPWWRRRRW